MPDTELIAELPSDLHYVDDTQPGITRKKLRGKFCYFEPSGQRITDTDEIKRINALAVPPAYTDVWICLDPRGHLQATGRDARGRKQYRYHARWREVRDADKYSRLREFGLALPKLRKQLEALLAAPGFSRDKVMATVITLLDATLIRVGNSQYARENKSYGLTTLRNRHVDIKGSEIQQRYAELMMLAAGPYALPLIREAMEAGWQGDAVGALWCAPLASTYFNMRKTTIYGGSNEVQRNIVSQVVLG